MYKPLFLGISNADPIVAYGVLIIIAVWLLIATGIALYFIGLCIKIVFNWIRGKLRKLQ
jgi:hypothetical protein